MEFLINAIPGVLPLIAAFIVCIISFVRDFSTNKFVMVFCVTVIIFYIIGVIVKRILRKQYDDALAAFMAELEEEVEEDVQKAQ